jgi:urease accessory protein
MFDTAPIAMQRSRGRAEVALTPEGRVARLYQQGCAKAFLPRCHGPEPEVVFLNTAGGVTGGDRLDYIIDVAPGGRVTATTQTAERAYRASDGSAPGEIAVTARVGAGGTLHWLPQETILFEGAALDRRTEVALQGDATCLMCETLVLGRAAMGETVARLALSDRRRVMRDGRPVLWEPLELTGAQIAAACGGAGLDGARVLATVALVAPDAPDALGRVRAALGDTPGAAASAWDGRLVVRLMGRDAQAVRVRLARILTTLRGRALPRVWQV